MTTEIAYVILIAGGALIGLWMSNIHYDLNVPHYISRKIGHAAGGMAYLLGALLFESGWWIFILATCFVAMLWIARHARPQTFRGVGGTGRPTETMAEVWFPLSSLPVIGIGWIWLDEPFISVACILFMAWGDAVTGLLRSQIYGKAIKGLWGSLGMLATCLIIAWAFITPFWIGAAAAFMATITEWACGDVSKIRWLRWADDNLMVPFTSFALAIGLLALSGGL